MGKSNLRVLVDCGINKPRLAVTGPLYRVEAEQESLMGFLGKGMDTSPGFLEGFPPFPLDVAIFLRAVVETGAFNHLLDLPGRDLFVLGILRLVDPEELFLTIAEMSSSQRQE